LLVAIALAVASPAAWAQTPTPPGTLTILSRPAGASYRLTGDQEIVGRAPATLARGLNGRYRIVGIHPGYERWKDVLDLDGAATDTVWMTLRAKHRALAAGRSLLVPGWGQFYAERPGRGWFWLSASAAAGTALAWTALRYEGRADDVRDAQRRLQDASSPGEVAAALLARDAAASELQDALDARRAASGAMTGVWGLAVLDAALVLRAPGRAPVTLGIEPGAGGSRSPGVSAVARVRF
jgi:hypothetical protein